MSLRNLAASKPCTGNHDCDATEHVVSCAAINPTHPDVVALGGVAPQHHQQALDQHEHRQRERDALQALRHFIREPRPDILRVLIDAGAALVAHEEVTDPYRPRSLAERDMEMP